jgi:hypothetical protein
MGEEASDVPHPGVGYLRLVEAFYDLSAIGVAFTAPIAGRPPQVSVAPPQAPLPQGWRLPADLH